MNYSKGELYLQGGNNVVAFRFQLSIKLSLEVIQGEGMCVLVEESLWEESSYLLDEPSLVYKYPGCICRSTRACLWVESSYLLDGPNLVQ